MALMCKHLVHGTLHFKVNVMTWSLHRANSLLLLVTKWNCTGLLERLICADSVALPCIGKAQAHFKCSSFMFFSFANTIFKCFYRSHLKYLKLKNSLKDVCEKERKARLRNKAFLQEFDAIENRLSTLISNSKTSHDTKVIIKKNINLYITPCTLKQNYWVSSLKHKSNFLFIIVSYCMC